VNANNDRNQWNDPLPVLRKKWSTVPAGENRITTTDLLNLPDAELLDVWRRTHDNASKGKMFDVRGWYHTLYQNFFSGRKIMDVGSGFGIDGLFFAQNGARMTFVDIVESNLEILKRLSRIMDLENVNFCWMESFDSLGQLADDYDVIWAQGSLINTPFEITRDEIQVLLKHLPVGGRWIELAYPKERWIKEGRLPFDLWGVKTDGQGTPWVEWYDLEKLRGALHPAQFDVVLYFNYYHDDFNWFDLLRRS